jgi:hypothetical protein
VRGYLYRDGDAWVAYWASLYEAHGVEHPTSAVHLTLAIADDWSDDADATSRSWVQVDAWPTVDQIQMSFVDPTGSLDPAHFGRPLSRQEALASPLRTAFLEAASHITTHDSRAAEVLGVS